MNYKLIGQRNLRKYTAPNLSPTYAAAVDAQIIVDSLCGVPWQKVAVKDATMTYHTDEEVGEVDGVKVGGLEMNVRIRDQFDAAMFCADHAGGQHRAFANAAVYHYVMPDGALPKLTRLVAKVTSDPYNAAGARIAILTNATGVIPTNCNDCRTGDAHADGVAPRTVGANGNWFPTMADCVFSATPAAGEVALPSGGLQLQKHLFVFVLMESYSTVRGNWLEGCSFIRNLISIETDAAIPGWTEGATYDFDDGEHGFGALDVKNMKFTKLFDMRGDARYVRRIERTNNDVTHEFLLVVGDFGPGVKTSWNDFVLYDITLGRIVDLGNAVTTYNQNIQSPIDLGWKLCSVEDDTGSSHCTFDFMFRFDLCDPWLGDGAFVFACNYDFQSGSIIEIEPVEEYVDVRDTNCGMNLPACGSVRVDRANGTATVVPVKDAGGYALRLKADDGHIESADEVAITEEQSPSVPGGYDAFYDGVVYGPFTKIDGFECGNVAKYKFSFIRGTSGDSCDYAVESLFGDLKISANSHAGMKAFRLTDQSLKNGAISSAWLLVGDFTVVNGLKCGGAAVINVVADAEKFACYFGPSAKVIPLTFPHLGICDGNVRKMCIGDYNEGSEGVIYCRM